MQDLPLSIYPLGARVLGLMPKYSNMRVLNLVLPVFVNLETRVQRGEVPGGALFSLLIHRHILRARRYLADRGLRRPMQVRARQLQAHLTQPQDSIERIFFPQRVFRLSSRRPQCVAHKHSPDFSFTDAVNSATSPTTTAMFGGATSLALARCQFTR